MVSEQTGYPELSVMHLERMTTLDLVRDGAKPLYQQVKEQLEQRIKAGKYKPHEKLPSERILCEIFKVSRITIRQALEEAVKEGLLYREYGRGTFVADESSAFEQPLENVQGFEDLLNAQGAQGKTEILATENVWTDIQMSSVFQVKAGTPLLQMNLLGYSEEKPVVYYQSYFREEVGRQVTAIAHELEKDKKPFSSTDLYHHYAGEKPNKIQQNMEATLADEELAQTLRVTVGHPLMKVTSFFLTSTNTPVEFRYAFYRGEKYIFHLTRRLDL